MTDFGRRLADMFKWVYDTDDNGVVDSIPLHAPDHEDDGSDEIDTTDLEGHLPSIHASNHEDGGIDEIDAAGLANRINFVDRGDPVAYDFLTGSFTRDESWNDLDLSSIVPAGALAVQLYVVISLDTVAEGIIFRKNGNVNQVNSALISCLVANQAHNNDLFLFCDASRVIEYYANIATWNFIALTVKGWYI